jgi:sulfatase maturation enzyme AslB (radical SAM superfamily)
MTTNGFLLTGDKLARLFDLGVRKYQRSLDEDKDMHTITRRFADGGPPFNQIWENLVTVRSMDLNIKVILQIHFHPVNLFSLGLLIERINKTFCRFFQSKNQKFFCCL